MTALTSELQARDFYVSDNACEHAHRRLALLEQCHDAGTIRRVQSVGVRSGWRCLEAGASTGVRYVCFAGAQAPTHGVDVTGFLDRGIASRQAHAGYLKGLEAAAFDPVEFLTWNTVASREQMGVDAAVLLDVFTLTPDQEPPWAARRSRSCSS
jgi:hypothetical protein